MKYIKSNIGFIIVMIFLAAITFNPQLKGLLLRGLIEAGLFKPDIEPSKSNKISAQNHKLILAPAVTFRSSTGKIIDISVPAGKVIFINFWATWCPPCIAEMPSINALKDKLKNKEILFMMVDLDNNQKKSNAFMKKYNYDFDLYTATSNIPEALFRGTLPTTVIINKQGEIVFHHEGMANYNSAKIESFLNSL